jgi:hypothetical protein
MPELRLYDRSRVTTDWQCPRKRYWQYEYGNKGLVGASQGLELFLGTTVHDGLAAIATQHICGQVDIDAIATTAADSVLKALLPQGDTFLTEEMDYAREQASLVEGLLRGFYRSAWPRLMAAYPDIRCVEQELIFDHDGLRFMSKPDLVLASPEGDIWYVEYKTTSSKKEGWVNSWNTAVQLHSSIRAIEASLHEKVTGVIVQGLYKGYESYGKQSSPFCYAYQRKGSPPFSEDAVSYEYKAGFKRYPTWEMAGGVKSWVAGMPDNVLSDQFPVTPPIFVKDDLIDAFFTQRKYREHEIKLATQMIEGINNPDATKDILDTAFPQRFDQCVSFWGSKCQYTKLCHGYVGEPLREGFEYRIPHHSTEVEAHATATTDTPTDLAPGA